MKAPPPDKKTIVGIGLLDDVALRETAAWSKRRGRTTETSLVGTTVGSYRITRVLGEGGVGIVYLGEHPRVGSRVAIKVLHEDFLDSSEMVSRFVQEARAANAIASPHIVRVSDFGTLEDGRDYAVMEYLEGSPLDAVLEESETLPADRVIEIMSQVAEAMSAAHEKQIVHRDLKPENLFLEKRVDGADFVRILDFGIAKLADAGNEEARKTMAGSVLGTPMYCAPEQANGREVGPAADIYALGAVAYELLTGRTVFSGNVVDVLLAKMSRDAPPLDQPEVPKELEALVLEMLSRDPKERPESMVDVFTRLEPLRKIVRRESRPMVKPSPRVDVGKAKGSREVQDVSATTEGSATSATPNASHRPFSMRTKILAIAAILILAAGLLRMRSSSVGAVKTSPTLELSNVVPASVVLPAPVQPTPVDSARSSILPSPVRVNPSSSHAPAIASAPRIAPPSTTIAPHASTVPKPTKPSPPKGALVDPFN